MEPKILEIKIKFSKATHEKIKKRAKALECSLPAFCRGWVLRGLAFEERKETAIDKFIAEQMSAEEKKK